MAIVLIPNQVVSFNNVAGCFIDTRTYTGKVSTNDCTEFQVRITPETGTELVTSPNFDSSTGWTLSVGSVIFGGLLSLAQNGANAQQTITTETGGYYEITVVIERNLGTSNVVLISPLVEHQTGNFVTGTTKGYFTATSTTTDIFIASAQNQLIEIQSVSVKKLTTIDATVETCDGEYVSDVDVIEYAADYAHIRHCWEGYDNDCYRFSLTPLGFEGENLFQGNAITTKGGFALTTLLGEPITWIP